MNYDECLLRTKRSFFELISNFFKGMIESEPYIWVKVFLEIGYFDMRQETFRVKEPSLMFSLLKEITFCFLQISCGTP